MVAMDVCNLQKVCFFIVIFGAASFAKELTTNYIDLLELPDNDEFLWGQRENKHASLLVSLANNISHHKNDLNAATHGIKKRQVQTDIEEPALPENKDYGACRTPSGELGNCRHIVYCRMPELNNDVWKIVSHLCVIKGSSIGICCPDYVSSRSAPQIIHNVNDNAKIVNKQPEQRGCGITTKQFPRVTGGRPAEPDEWPWMAAILRPGLPYVWCGGVLITDRLVMSAAHCIHKMEIDELFVRLGEYNTHAFNETRARDFRIGAMVTHRDYDPLNFENDIALIRVERPALFNTYIWPICLPPIGENWEGRAGVVTGWGSKTFSGPHSDILMEVLLPVWKQEECRNAMVERIPDTVLCAGVKEGGQDSCQGDSGGPFLVQLPNNRWVSIAIVSWGIRCGEPNRPGVYTRVDKYLHWIIENSDI